VPTGTQQPLDAADRPAYLVCGQQLPKVGPERALHVGAQGAQDLDRLVVEGLAAPLPLLLVARRSTV